MVAQRIANLLKASPEGEGVHPSQRVTLSRIIRRGQVRAKAVLGRFGDGLVAFGYYEGDKLIYAARTRNGFTPATRGQLFRRFKGLEIAECPFARPEAADGVRA